MAIGTYHIVYKYQTCAYAGANDIELQFCDVQTKQIIAAKMHGITPISSRKEAINKCDELQLEDRLVRLSSNNLYYVRDLTHSVPYLVPEAETLLSDIAREFQTISGTNCRFEVTSVLRTKEDISKLQQVNVNATSNSCHCYATTFDISYVSFKTDVLHPKNNAELREVLSQAVYNMRKKGRCYVKFENNQKCYHTTVR